MGYAMASNPLNHYSFLAPIGHSNYAGFRVLADAVIEPQLDAQF